MRNAVKIVQEFFPVVTKVRDSKRNSIIEVTKQDQAIAKRYKHKECAMAVACKRANKADGVVISRSVAYVIKDNVATRFLLPPSVQKEVVSFDRGGGFAEGEYELKKPTVARKLGAPGGSKPHKHRGPGRKIHRHLTMNVRSSLGY
jgi:hypothetical protein